MSTPSSLLAPPAAAAPSAYPTPSGLAPIADRSWRMPRPNRMLMRLLGPVGRWLLHGMPGLRRIPGLRDLPLVRGYFRVRAIELPNADRRRLASAVDPRTVAFLAPNHPEFATDWLIDKELSTYVAPHMASWADRGIVSLAPRFFGMNNLVSNDGGADAKEYSIQCALAGDAVLLHPEGTVRWTNDFVHPLFPGVAQMAIAAARRSERPVYIVPVVWKYRFTGDVSAGLHREMAALERGLGLPSMDWLSVSQRFRVVQCSALAARMAHFGYRAPLDADFFERQESFQRHLVASLGDYDVGPAGEEATQRLGGIIRRIRRARRALSHDDRPDAREARRRLTAALERAEEALRLGEMPRSLYGGETLTQEQIFECLKRTRDRLVRTGRRNRLAVMLPRPAGARVVHVAVPDPIRVVAVDFRDADDYERDLVERTRTAMQHALDTINRRIAGEVDRHRHPNALAAPAGG